MRQGLIYKHTLIADCASKGKSYIGITSRDPWLRGHKNGGGYNIKNQPQFVHAIQKYGGENFSHEIIETGIKSLEEANKKEKYGIAYYHTGVYDPKCGGYNTTQGGDGTSGHKWTENLRNKIQKSVYCVEQQLSYDSLTQAATATNCLISKISECCHNKRSTAGGYHGRFIINGEIEPIKYVNKKTGVHGKKVYCIELKQYYINASEASRVTGVYHSNISNCCNGTRKSAGGYHGKYYEGELTDE